MALVECVPNFSEGRRKDVIEAIVAALSPGVTLLGYESDQDHNRTVVTLAGEPDAIVESAVRGAKKAAELIDLRNHKGQHPRMGATDVIPFIPISGIDMAGCIELAKRAAKRISADAGVPTFLYGEAATRPERANLADVRNGEFEGLRELIGKDPARTPDFGPNAIHPSAGATAVGARFFLVAFNVNLESTDLKLAKSIAKAIRERDGGMPAVKALGLELKNEGCVQISMNLVDYRKTSPAAAYNRIEELAGKAGVKVRESEIVGLVPQAALGADAATKLKIKNFDGSKQVIENKLAGGKFSYLNEVGRYLEDLASAAPTPGGGAAAAVLGATGVALGEMVANLTVGKKKYAEVEGRVKADLAALSPLRTKMLAMFEEDARAFEGFGAAGALPKNTPEEISVRKAAMQKALKAATESPAKTADLGLQAFRRVHSIAQVGNKHAISDCGVGALSLYAAVNAAVMNMRINLPGIEDPEFKARYGKLADEYSNEAKKLLDDSLKVVIAAIGN
ncbi:MAG: glutamate formimidoyltransferase [Planctomycetes bacterium]|nr:glutamate formimidoyltransferase [Planctomycetota bacterium]